MFPNFAIVLLFLTFKKYVYNVVRLYVKYIIYFYILIVAFYPKHCYDLKDLH